MKCLVAVCCLVISLAVVFAGPAASESVLLDDDFELTISGAYPSSTGWYSLSPGKSAFVSTNSSYSGTKSFLLDSWPWASRVDGVLLGDLPDRMSYRAAVRVDPTNGLVGLVGFMDKFNSHLPAWNFFTIDGSAGNISFTGVDTVSLAAYARGQWCLLQADLDYLSLTANLWVNGTLIAENVPILPREIVYGTLGLVPTNILSVSAPATYAFSNQVYFDYIAVWENQPSAALSVTIDIKPGDNPNTINPRAQGLLPVCIFSSSSFDATEIDPSTVTLAGASVAIRSANQKFMAHFDDLDGDGLLDLVLHFENSQLDFTQLADGFAVLTGLTYDGIEFSGQDDIVLLSNPRQNQARR